MSLLPFSSSQGRRAKNTNSIAYAQFLYLPAIVPAMNEPPIRFRSLITRYDRLHLKSGPASDIKLGQEENPIDSYLPSFNDFIRMVSAPASPSSELTLVAVCSSKEIR